MRKITRDAVDAFLNGREFRQGNMRVENDKMYLHGNIIAWIDCNNYLWICDGGYQTVTTKERLNALPNVSIKQKSFTWYLNGERWDGTQIRIGKVR